MSDPADPSAGAPFAGEPHGTHGARASGEPGARPGAAPDEAPNGWPSGTAAPPAPAEAVEAAGAAEAGGDVAGTILDDVAAVAAERDEYLQALQRLKADFENYRNRVLRQQEEQSRRAALDLVGKLLPVLDTLDLA
jgi:molecular chaperone GrpE